MSLQQADCAEVYNQATKAMIFDHHTKEHRNAIKSTIDICEKAETGEECNAVMASMIAGFMRGLVTLNRPHDLRKLRAELRNEDYYNVADVPVDFLPEDGSLNDDEVMMHDLKDVYTFRRTFGGVDKKESDRLKLVAKAASTALRHLEEVAQVLGLDDHYIHLKDERLARDIEKQRFCEAFNRKGITSAERAQLIEEYGGNRLKNRAISTDYASEIQAKETIFAVDVNVLDSPFLPQYESLKPKIFRTSKKALDYAEYIADAIGWRIKSVVVKEVFRNHTKVIKIYDETFALP